jgi:hypothetical protein
MRRLQRLLTLAVLLTALPSMATTRRAGRQRRLKSGKNSKGKAGGGGNLGATTVHTGPLHKTDCGGRVCRPGEGNLKGYQHWSMPWEPPPIDSLSKLAAREWGKGAPFPARFYEPLVSVAARVQQDKIVIFAAADFDFRELAENWYRATQRASISNVLLYALDSEAYDYFSARSIPTANGTDNLDAWASTRLQRHLQRALAERHMAAAALVHAGYDVLLTDTTHVFQRPVTPLLRSLGSDGSVDIFAQRGGCSLKAEPAIGCGFVWNFLFLRGNVPDTRRARVVDFVQAAVDLGMVDFYLRWWAGHHCVFMGYVKLLRSAQPQVELVSGSAETSAQSNLAHPNSTSVISLRHRNFCAGGGSDSCLRIGQLPADRFPPAGHFPQHRAHAIIGRSARPDLDPKRSHRLRLDRYDEVDFENLRTQMVKDGLWLLPP